jgi:hypothetical protein
MVGDRRHRIDATLGRVRRRWRLVVALGLLGFVVGSSLATARHLVGTKEYTATTLVLVQAQGSTSGASPDAASSRVYLATQARFVTSATVVAGAERLVGADAQQAGLPGHLTVKVKRGAWVMAVSYTASTPSKAQAYSEAFARAYLDARTQQAMEPVAAPIADLRGQYVALQTQLPAYSRSVASTRPTSAAHQVALVRLHALRSQMSTLRKHIQQLTPLTSDAILMEPRAPTEPDGLSANQLELLGLIAGLLLGALLSQLPRRPPPREARGPAFA